MGEKNPKIDSEAENTQEQEFDVKQIYVHPEYDRKCNYHDIALLELDRSAEYVRRGTCFDDNFLFLRFRISRHVLPACLHQTEEIEDKTAQAVVWGTSTFAGYTYDELLKRSLDIISNDKCNESYYDNINEFPNGIISHQLCAGDFNRQKDSW